MAGWQSLIIERHISALIVKSPVVEEDKSLKMSNRKINQIEKNIRKGYDPDDPLPELPDIKKVQLKYRKVRDYTEIYERLVRLEDQNEKIRKSLQVIRDIELEWDTSEIYETLARFIVSRENTDVRLVVGDEVKLSLGESKKFWLGIIMSYDASDSVTLKIVGIQEGLPLNKTRDFTLRFVEGNETYKRMIEGLRMFENGFMDT